MCERLHCCMIYAVMGVYVSLCVYMNSLLFLYVEAKMCNSVSVICYVLCNDMGLCDQSSNSTEYDIQSITVNQLL